MSNIELMTQKFDQNFSVLVVYHLNEEKEIILGDPSRPKRCRFCGKSEPEVTFNKVAHSLPHFIGNRHLKSMYECDSCNGNVFSLLESQFAQFMQLYHTICQVSNGGKTPTFKNNSAEESRIDIQNGNINIKCFEGEDLKTTNDKEHKLIKIDGSRSYVPQNVFKIFVKMALTIMPASELNHFGLTFDWLLSRQKIHFNSGLILLERRYNKPFQFPSCFLFKRKDSHQDDVPCYFFGIAYSYFFFQTYIPLCDQDSKEKKQFTMLLLPTPLDQEKVPYVLTKHDLSSDIKVVKEPVSITLGYNDMTEKIY